MLRECPAVIVDAKSRPLERGRGRARYGAWMFIFFNNKLGCAGSIVVSLLLTGVVILALRGCGH